MTLILMLLLLFVLRGVNVVCVKLAQSGTKAFWLGHLSDHNNLPELAYACVKHALTENGFSVGGDVALNVIPKYWIEAAI